MNVKVTSPKAETKAPNVRMKTEKTTGLEWVLCSMKYSAPMTKSTVRRLKAENIGMLTRDKAESPTVTFATKKTVEANMR